MIRLSSLINGGHFIFAIFHLMCPRSGFTCAFCSAFVLRSYAMPINWVHVHVLLNRMIHPMIERLREVFPYNNNRIFLYYRLDQAKPGLSVRYESSHVIQLNGIFFPTLTTHSHSPAIHFFSLAYYVLSRGCVITWMCAVRVLVKIHKLS